jgi:predicted NACHT family NTPase
MFDLLEKAYTWIMKDSQSRIPIALAVFGAISALIGAFFSKFFWPLFKYLLIFLLSIFNKMSYRARFFSQYLDFMIKTHKTLPNFSSSLLPITEKAQEIDKIYISLQLSEKIENDMNISVYDAIKSSNKILILGDPGSGKTTTLKYLALVFARSNKKRSNLKNTELRNQENSLIKKAKTETKLASNEKKSKMPIFLSLNKLSPLLNSKNNKTILDFIVDDFKTLEKNRNIRYDFFMKKISKGECIFLFDAFDELDSKTKRTYVSQIVGDFSNSISSGNKIIVTSRKVGYTGELRDYLFKTFVVQRLSRDMIAELVGKWYASLNEELLANEILSTIHTNRGIYELAVNPMLLSLIVLVQYVRKLIPDKRHVLYDECINILVERRNAVPSIQDMYNKVIPSDEAIYILRELAFALHFNKLRDVALDDLLNNYIPNILLSIDLLKSSCLDPKIVLKNIEERSQLIIRRGFNEKEQELCAFSHLTFQEYLAATALKEYTSKDGFKKINDMLLELCEDDLGWWDEVAQLYIAQSYGQQQKEFMDKFQKMRKAFKWK